MFGDEKGYTLIEVLIALSLFAIGMLAVAGMQISGIQGNATAKWHTGAASWSADRIERLMTLDYDDPALVDGSVTEGIYTVSWVVTEDVPINNVKTIAVTVSWTDRGINKNTTFNYYKADL